MGFVVFVNSIVMMFAGGLMLLDAVVFPGTFGTFLMSGFLTLVAGACLALGSSSELAGFRRPHTFLLTGSVWMTAAVTGAVPLVVWGMSFTDGFFEAMSGITTTGSTVMVGLDDTPRGILAWRAILNWIGGVGFIVTGIALLPILRVGGMQLFRTESSERGEKELVGAARFARGTLVGLRGHLCGVLLRLPPRRHERGSTHSRTPPARSRPEASRPRTPRSASSTAPSCNGRRWCSCCRGPCRSRGTSGR